MKISVVTVCFNSAATIEDTLRSVMEQDHNDVEHLIIDGLSTDNTLEIVDKFQNSNLVIVSESDLGLYDAMNKGASKASGDIVAFLNSDDWYVDSSVLSAVVDEFNRSSADIVCGNIRMVDEDGHLGRYWRPNYSGSRSYLEEQLPHPGMFFKASALKMLDPPFDLKYRICADLKQQMELIHDYDCRVSLLNKDVTNMRFGGTSTNGLMAHLRGWKEAYDICNEVVGHGGLRFTATKVGRKVAQFWRR